MVYDIDQDFLAAGGMLTGIIFGFIVFVTMMFVAEYFKMMGGMVAFCVFYFIVTIMASKNMEEQYKKNIEEGIFYGHFLKYEDNIFAMLCLIVIFNIFWK